MGCEKDEEAEGLYIAGHGNLRIEISPLTLKRGGTVTVEITRTDSTLMSEDEVTEEDLK